jgi:hypothetical protein
MPITTKDTVLKRLYEENGQQQMFGYDNLQFKTVNHPRKHKLINLCSKFKIKKLIIGEPLHLRYTATRVT